jgi:thioredoxin-like negative regulator of GroEL
VGGLRITPLEIQRGDLRALLADPRPLLVAFEAAGSAPCALLAPRLRTVAQEFGRRVLVVRVLDAGDASFAARHHLLWIPTLAFWHGGREVLRLAGAAPIEALRAHLRFLLEDGPCPDAVEGPRRAVCSSFGRPAVH